MRVKKGLSLLLALFMILSIVAPAYADVDDVNIKFEGRATVTISGTSNYTQKIVTITIFDRDKEVLYNQCITDINGNYSFNTTLDKFDIGKNYTGKVKIEGEEKQFSFTTKGNKKYNFGEEVKPVKHEVLFFQDDIKIDLEDLDIDDNSRVKVTESNVKSGDELSKQGKIINIEFKNIDPNRLFEIGIPTSSSDIQKVSLYYYDPELKDWEYIDSKRIKNLVVARVNREGIYGVFEDTKAPKNLSIKLKENLANRITLELYAEDASGIELYEIFRDGNSIDHRNSNRYSDTQVSPGKTYVYELKAKDNLGNVSDYSSKLSVKVENNTSAVGEKVTVSMRIEGYDKTLFYDDNLEVDVFGLDPYLVKSAHKTATNSNGWAKEKFSDPTVAHALVTALGNKSMKASKDYVFEDYGWSCYLSRVLKDKEFEYRNTSGWMYRVNGWLPNYGCQDYILEDGDRIEWFFGVNGFSTWFTDLYANKTKVAPGEEVTLTLNGNINKLDKEVGRGKTFTKKISGAVLKINDREKEDLVTDRNGQVTLKFDKAGTYEISAERIDGMGFKDIVRPMPIKIKVSGDPVKPTKPFGPDSTVSNPDYKKENDVVNDKGASEKDIVKAVDSASNKLNEKAKEMKTEKDAQKLVSYIDDVSNILSKAAERIETEAAAKALADESANTVKLLVKSSWKITKNSTREDISDTAVKNMNTALILMNKIENEKDIDEIANDMIEASAKLSKNIGEDNSKELKYKAVEVAEKVINKASTKKIDKNNMDIKGSKVTVKVEVNEITATAKKAAEKTKKMLGKLTDSGIDVTKQFDKKLSIHIPKAGKEEIETTLSSGVIEKALQHGLNRVEVKTEVAGFNISSETFGDRAKNEDISLSAKKVDTSKLPEASKKQIPSKGIVIDFDARVGGERISSFHEPIEVSIPYEDRVKKGERVTVFFLKDDGTIEPMGGKYDPMTKTVKFITNHFSKYFAKETIKEFKDLSKVSWAEDAIEIMAGKGIIGGRNDREFDPNASITRAEFSALITRMLKYETDNNYEIPFVDVNKKAWYFESVASAYKNGLINGRSADKFDPQGNITRQEMAKIIAKVLEQHSYKSADIDELNIFKDKDDIAVWARDGVALSAREGIITGMNNETIVPTQNANRAQAAVMIYRLYELIMK
jgi:hypothetical protein